MHSKSYASRLDCATWLTPIAALPKWPGPAPGGHVAVLEFSTPTWQPFKAVYGWYFRHLLPRIGRLVARSSGDAYEYLPTSVGEFPQGEALAERMRAAGLADVHRYPLTLGVATLYVGKKPHSG